MPKAKSKKIVKKTAAKPQNDLFTNVVSLPDRIKSLREKEPKKFWWSLIIIGLFLILLTNKNLVVAAIVNGQPISNFELQARLNKQFRSQTINQMINEKILEQEATKKGTSVNQEELSAKVKETEAQYGGAETLNSILSQQGISREDFISQTRLQLLVEKLYSAEASPSAEDIDKFMSDNKDLPEATDGAKFRETATTQVRQTNLAKIFNEKFQALKQTAKIQIL